VTSLMNIHSSTAGGRDDNAGGTTIAEHKVSSIDVDEIELLQSVGRQDEPTLRSLPRWNAISGATAPAARGPTTRRHQRSFVSLD